VPVINAVCILWDAFLSHRNAVANINKKKQAAVTTAVEHTTSVEETTPRQVFQVVVAIPEPQTPSVVEPVVHAA
jgi:hypothetical protein